MLRRAVFSDIQRKGLERRFQVQKYISKPDRKKLADQLGLKDSQVRNLKVAKWKENEIVHKISNPDKFSMLYCARCFKAELPMQCFFPYTQNGFHNVMPLFNLTLHRYSSLLSFRSKSGSRTVVWSGGTARRGSCCPRGAPESRLCPVKTINILTWVILSTSRLTWTLLTVSLQFYLVT